MIEPKPPPLFPPPPPPTLPFLKVALLPVLGVYRLVRLPLFGYLLLPYRSAQSIRDLHTILWVYVYYLSRSFPYDRECGLCLLLVVYKAHLWFYQSRLIFYVEFFFVFGIHIYFYILYFGYMFNISLILFVMTGSVGFAFCLWFTKLIYGVY